MLLAGAMNDCRKTRSSHCRINCGHISIRQRSSKVQPGEIATFNLRYTFCLPTFGLEKCAQLALRGQLPNRGLSGSSFPGLALGEEADFVLSLKL